MLISIFFVMYSINILSNKQHDHMPQPPNDLHLQELDIVDSNENTSRDISNETFNEGEINDKILTTDRDTPEFNASEPLWSQGRSLDSIATVCRSLGIPEEQVNGRSREQLIQQCGYLNIHPDLSDTILQQQCASFSGKNENDPSILNLTREQLENCIVEGKAAEWLAHLGVITLDEGVEIIENTQLPPEDKNNLLTELAQAQAEIVDSINANNKNNTMQQEFLLNLTSSIKNEFGHEFKTILKSLESIQSNVKVSQSWTEWLLSYFPTALRYTANTVGVLYNFGRWVISAFIRVGKLGFDFVMWMLNHPKTAQFCLLFAEQFRNQWCREVSIYLGRYSIRENRGYVETAVDYLSGSANWIKALTWDAFEILVTEKFDMLWSGFEDLVTVGFTYLTGGVSSFASYLGPARIFIGITASTFKIACQKGLENTVYAQLIQGNVDTILRIVNPTSCLTMYSVEVKEAIRRHFPVDCKQYTDENNCTTNDQCMWHSTPYRYGPPEGASIGTCSNRPIQPTTNIQPSIINQLNNNNNNQSLYTFQRNAAEPTFNATRQYNGPQLTNLPIETPRITRNYAQPFSEYQPFQNPLQQPGPIESNRAQYTYNMTHNQPVPTRAFHREL